METILCVPDRGVCIDNCDVNVSWCHMQSYIDNCESADVCSNITTYHIMPSKSSTKNPLYQVILAAISLIDMIQLFILSTKDISLLLFRVILIVEIWTSKKIPTSFRHFYHLSRRSSFNATVNTTTFYPSLVSNISSYAVFNVYICTSSLDSSR